MNLIKTANAVVQKQALSACIAIKTHVKKHTYIKGKPEKLNKSLVLATNKSNTNINNVPMIVIVRHE